LAKTEQGGSHGFDPRLPDSEGERRYDVRYRDQQGRQRSRAFSVRKDAQAFKLDVERRGQAGLLYQAPPETFSALARSWLERYTIGAAGRVRPRPRSIALAEDTLKGLAPLANSRSNGSIGRSSRI